LEAYNKLLKMWLKALIKQMWMEKAEERYSKEFKPIIDKAIDEAFLRAKEKKS